MVVFVGDLCDRGPKNADVLKLVMNLVQSKQAICILGNHDDKLRRHLKGNRVKINNGLNTTIRDLDRTNKKFKKKVYEFLSELPVKVHLDNDKLLVSHAGLKEKYQDSGKAKVVRAKCLYGETTGEKDENGFPVRLDWAAEYRGRRVVVHGHVKDLAGPIVKNNVYAVDTGCVYGGRLTALRYPEMNFMSVNAHDKYHLSK